MISDDGQDDKIRWCLEDNKIIFSLKVYIKHVLK